MLGMSNEPNASVVDRVHRTLKRLGFDDCVLRELVDGQITLFCPGADRNDHGMIHIAIRLIPGIKSVVFATETDKESKS